MSCRKTLESKPSGLDWPQSIPADWQVKKLSFFAAKTRNSFVDGPFGSELKNEEYVDSGVPLIQLNNIGEGAHQLNGLKFVTDEKADQLARHNASPGDLVIAKMADPVARAALVRGDYSRYVIVADCVRLTVDAALADASFLVYAINAPTVRAQAIKRASGITRLRINLGELKDLRVPCPTLDEQRLIVDFLDKATRTVDALIEEQRHLMEVLNEKRQAIISHAVTKGINQNAPMKPSGVTWLGETPAHWNVFRLRRAVRSIKAGPFGSSLTKDLYVSSGYRVYGQEQVIANDFTVGDYHISPEMFAGFDQYRVSPGDILISCVGTFGKIALVPRDVVPGIINPRLLRLTCSDVVDPGYLVEALRSTVVFQQMAAATRGGTMDVINISTLNDIIVPIPPREEQSQLKDWIHQHAAAIDALTAQTRIAIVLLEERRSALISAAVTGQIDVRSAELQPA